MSGSGMKISIISSNSFPKDSFVEVSSDADGFHGVWYVAKVLEPPPFATAPKKRTKRAFLVEYQTLVSEDGSKPLTEFIDSAFIRPLPPTPETDHAFEVNEVVDAFHLDGWWMGVVVKVELDSYSVYFDNPPDLLEFKRSDLRTHWDWDGCKWVRPQKKDIQQKEIGTGSLKRKRGAREKHLIKDDECDTDGGAVGKIVIKDCAITDIGSPKITGESTGSEDASAEKAAKLSDRGCSTREAEMAIVEIPSNMDNIYKTISMLFDDLCPPPLNVGNSVMDVVNSSGKQMEEANSMTDATFSCPLKKLKKEIHQKKSGTGSLKKKRGECQNPLIKGKESDAAGSAIDKMVVKDFATTNVESPIITGKYTGCSTREAEMAIVKMPGKKANIDKPLSMSVYGVCPPTVTVDSRFNCDGTFNQLDKPKGRLIEFFMESTANESMTDIVPNGSRCMSYVENSSILHAINSLEVFQMMPQKPHFNPLVECKELYREGLAIGYMLTFANVVKQTSKLQVSDPINLFNSISEALRDLEMHGFKVKPVRKRLTRLQSIKERQEQLKKELKDFEERITEQTHQQNKMKAEFDKVVKKLMMLEERKAMLMPKIEKNDTQIAELKSNLDVLNQDIQNAELDFETLAASSW